MDSIHGQFMDDSLVKYLLYFDSLAYFEISNQNHHRQTSYDYTILTQIIVNFLELNNSNELFRKGRTDANFTSQNTW
jgi:hypothetical protein